MTASSFHMLLRLNHIKKSYPHTDRQLEKKLHEPPQSVSGATGTPLGQRSPTFMSSRTTSGSADCRLVPAALDHTENHHTN